LVKTEKEMMLEEQNLLDDDFVFSQTRFGESMDTEADHFWADMDEYTSGEAKNMTNTDEFIQNEIDITAAIMDAVYDEKEMDPNKRILTAKEMKEADATNKLRRR
jgi:hypothetical protein